MGIQTRSKGVRSAESSVQTEEYSPINSVSKWQSRRKVEKDCGSEAGLGRQQTKKNLIYYIVKDIQANYISGL